MVRHSRIKEKSVVGTVSQLLHSSEGLFIWGEQARFSSWIHWPVWPVRSVTRLTRSRFEQPRIRQAVQPLSHIHVNTATSFFGATTVKWDNQANCLDTPHINRSWFLWEVKAAALLFYRDVDLDGVKTCDGQGA